MHIPKPQSLMTSNLRQTISDLRERIGATSNEAVTGRHFDLTGHLSGSIGKAMLSQHALDDISLQRSQLSLRESRLSLVQQSLTSIHDGTIGLDIRMQSALGSNDVASQGAAALEARSALDSIFSTLGTRHGERFLFAGDATSTQPLGSVDDLLSDIRQIAATAVDATDFANSIDTYFNSSTGGWQQDIYAGTVTASDADAVTGAHPGITQLISGLAVMALAGPDENLPILAGSTTIVGAAAQSLRSGQTELTNARALLGLSEAQMAQEKESLDIEERILTLSFNEMTARDQYEAASELRELETSLEASYLLTSRLANLSLLNFLR